MGEAGKDILSRERGKECKNATGELLSKILGNDSYQNARLLNKKTDIVREATAKLDDPLSLLKMFKLSVERIAMDNIYSVEVQNALLVLESVLEKSKHPVLNQDQANEIEKQKLFRLKGQETNVESHFQGDIVPNQGINESYGYLPGSFPLEVPNQGQTIEAYKQLPGSFPFKGQETIVESHFQGDIVPNQGINESYGYLRGSFPLKGQETNVKSHFPWDTVPNQGKTSEAYKQLPGSFPFKGQETDMASHIPWVSMVASTNKGLNVDPMQLQLEMSKYEGGSYPILNNLSNVENLNNVNNMIEEMLDWSEVTIVKDYTVFKPNANVLNEIFQKHPNTDEKFQVKDPGFQSFIMKSLAEVYQKIESKMEMLELKDIPTMKVKIQDMEHIGLQLSWLEKILEEVSKVLKDKADKAERKRLQEEIISLEAKTKEAKVKLAKLEKKPRLE